MPIFIIVALTIYTAMHLLVYWGVRPLIVNHPVVPTLTLCWMGAMVVSPFVVHVLESLERETAARALAWVSFTWMGLIFLAFCCFALLGGLELLLFLASKLVPALSPVRLHDALTSVVVVLLVTGTGLYGIYNAKRLEVRRVIVATDKLAPGQRIHIAQVSDIHLGLLNREEVLAPIVLKLRELSPDLLVATGDVVDAQINHVSALRELWHEVDAPLGKFAVTGNHETYAGLDQSLEFLETSGFTLLRNEAVGVGSRLTLVGIDYDRANPPTPLLTREPGARFVLVLKHLPLLSPGSEGSFDLQLSGHTHDGQIFPFTGIVALRFPMIAGLYPLLGGGQLYTSRGTATWGPPMRVGSVAEITLIELVGEEI